METILFAEDNLDDVLLVGLAFKKLGISYSLQVVPDGTVVLQYLKGEGPYKDRQQFPMPRLLLLDLEMPRMNGFQVLQWLRKEPEFKHLPVVVLTSSCSSPDVIRAYLFGADSFLTKANDFVQYGSALKQTLDFWTAGGEVLPKAA